MNAAVCAVCAVLMVLGAAELVRLVSAWRQKPLTGCPSALVVIPESAETCECAVRAAAESLRRLDRERPAGLVCVNRTGDPEIDKICRFLALRYPFLRVCRPGELERGLLTGP